MAASLAVLTGPINAAAVHAASLPNSAAVTLPTSPWHTVGFLPPVDEPSFISGLRPLPTILPATQQRSSRSPPGFSTPNPVWTATVPSKPTTAPVPATLVATIQANVASSQERQRTASLALEHEWATGAALTAQLATAQRLIHGHSPAGLDIPPPILEALQASGLDADHVAAIHAQAAGLHNIQSLVSIVLDPASSHYPRWRG
jgi:hypothetical protein